MKISYLRVDSLMSAIMATNKLKRSWLNQAKKAVTELMESQTETLFDAHLFGDQVGQVLCNFDVKFPDIEEKPLQSLRAARLKMLGYKYVAKIETWKASPGLR